MDKLATRYITIKLTLSSEIFDDSNGSNVKFITANSGVDDAKNSYPSVDCTISKAIGNGATVAYVKISGMTRKDIELLSRTHLKGQFDVYVDNQIDIFAGYELSQNGLPPLVYSGGVIIGGAEFDSNNRDFIIKSIAVYSPKLLNNRPTNSRGEVNLDDLFRTIATQANFLYQSHGVTGKAHNPIYTGDSFQQLKEATRDYGYQFHHDLSTIYVAPEGEALINKTAPLNKTTGMLGNPTVDTYGINVRARFNGAITLGQKLNIESDYKFANGEWTINAMEHKLQNNDDKFETKYTLSKMLIEMK